MSAKAQSGLLEIVRRKMFRIGTGVNLFGTVACIDSSTSTDDHMSGTLNFEPIDCLCIVYSNVGMIWSLNGDRKNRLEDGGVVVVDCCCSFSYKLVEVGEICFVFVPHDFYDESVVFDILQSNELRFSTIVSFLFRSLTNANGAQVTPLVLSIAQLVGVSSNCSGEEVNNNQRASLFHKITSVIYANAKNANFYLEQAAELSFCSKRKLHSCLVEMGTSFSKMINENRVNYLSQLLATDSDSRIESLCYKSGFNSSAYAIKVFKESKGETPQQYRSRLISVRTASVHREIRDEYIRAKEELNASLQLYQSVVGNNVMSEIPEASARLKQTQEKFESLYSKVSHILG
ncbi:helix-turn-helix domain-containing protein [Vibrio scophthalmi]|uniref:HTH araC/xylS-type domain-containing protein n=1 Tax=Vibrio scophthalmi TaxID=45658 RepID=A0A1E3WKM8_9VIBR|nr:helix-turn-helix domain-containing protein [Vibrio scophthalmi]ODS05577.1 hypothetical protein VSF3289_04718 [Vibrio scophthalmi]